jgi:predicted NAD-dependent protein-ADP-ribosyltransferase YbiA (DUF1768 family)
VVLRGNREDNIRKVLEFSAGSRGVSDAPADPWPNIEEAHRVEIMQLHDPTLGVSLLATGNRPLIEGNDWGDTFWGQVDGRGENHLGELLLKIREELRAQ